MPPVRMCSMPSERCGTLCARAMHPRIARSRRLAWHWCMRCMESVRAVDKVFHVAESNAIYTRHPLERAFRDVHVAVQHGAALPSYFEICRQGAAWAAT